MLELDFPHSKWEDNLPIINRTRTINKNKINLLAKINPKIQMELNFSRPVYKTLSKKKITKLIKQP